MNYTHPDQILRYVKVGSEGPPELKQSCEDFELICRGHRRPAIGIYCLLLNAIATPSEF